MWGQARRGVHRCGRRRKLAATQASAAGGGPGQRGAMQVAEARAGTTPGWGARTRTVGRQHGRMRLRAVGWWCQGPGGEDGFAVLEFERDQTYVIICTNLK